MCTTFFKSDTDNYFCTNFPKSDTDNFYDISLKDAVRVITGNDQLKVYIGVVLAYNMLVQLAGGMALYYFKYVTGNEDLFPYFTTAASFAEIIALFAFPVLSRFMNKKQVFAIASFTPAVGLIALIVFGVVAPTNIPLIILCGLLFKFGSGLTLGATTVMLADVIDYGEVKLGTRNESIIASFQTLLVKTASAVAGWLIGVGLTIVGYVQNVPQTPQTIMGMRILMGVIPSVVTVMAFVVYVKGYKLDSSRMEEISAQLKAKKVTTILNNGPPLFWRRTWTISVSWAAIPSALRNSAGTSWKRRRDSSTSPSLTM